MTESIISPWFFYLLSVVGAIKGVFAVVGVFSCLIAIMAIVGHFLVKEDQTLVDEDANFDPLCIPIWGKLKRAFLPLALIFLPLSILIPSKQTLIWMVVAKNVTYQNVEKAIEAGADFKNELKKDMIEIIETLKGEKENVADK